MKRAGCRRVAYGIESGSQKLLDNIKKGITLEQIEKAIKLTEKAKIEIIAFFILGLPGETKELTQQTIDFAKKLNPDYVKFNLAVPYPGTKMYEDAIKEELLKSLDWERFTSFSSMGIYEPIYIPKGMVGSDLVKFQKKALRQFYFRPSYIFKRLLRMRRKDEFARNIRAALILFGGTK